MAAKRRSLGKGLDALLSGSGARRDEQRDNDQSKMADGNNAPAAASADASADPASSPTSNSSSETLRELPVELIQRGQYQPRREFEQEALEELAASIRAQGVMQPIVVRPISADRFEIIAGERRWRAAQLAELAQIPALIRDVPDEAAIAMALIENLQREDLNPMEEAVALDRLQTEFGLTQQEVADAVGKSRSAVANLLRLNSLAHPVRQFLESRQLEMGHARCLITLPDDKQLEVAKEIISKSLSVRQTEALVRRIQQATPAAPPGTVDPNIRQLETELAEKLGAAVNIQHTAKGKGKLVVKYSSLDELDGILSHLR